MISIEDSSKIINALKSGVVPKGNIENFCVGREAQMRELERCLQMAQDGNGIVKFLCGNYGSGKTFLLNLLKQNALEKGFVVSKVHLDRALQFNSLESLYYHIMHNLLTGDKDGIETSFEKIFDNWIENLKKSQSTDDSHSKINDVILELNKYSTSFARAFLYYIRAKISKDYELAAAIVSWLTGEKNIPYSLKSKFEVVGSIDKTNAVDFLKTFLQLIKLIGYKGLVITIDELELILNERSDTRRLAYTNLRYFIDLCGSNELGNCMIVFASTKELFSNPEKGFKSYEALYQRLGSFSPENSSSLIDMRQPVMMISKLSQQDFQLLTDRVCDLYKTVYNKVDLKITNESLKNWTLLSLKKSGKDLQELVTREYLMKLLEILDVIEQHPKNLLFRNEIQFSQREGKDVFINRGVHNQ